MKSNQTSSRLCQVLDRGQVGGREGGRGSHCREGVHRHTTERKLKHGHCNTQLKPPKNAEEEGRRLPFGIQVLPLFLILLTRETAPSVPIHFQGRGRVTQKPQGSQPASVTCTRRNSAGVFKGNHSSSLLGEWSPLQPPPPAPIPSLTMYITLTCAHIDLRA